MTRALSTIAEDALVGLQIYNEKFKNDVDALSYPAMDALFGGGLCSMCVEAICTDDFLDEFSVCSRLLRKCPIDLLLMLGLGRGYDESHGRYTIILQTSVVQQRPSRPAAARVYVSVCCPDRGSLPKSAKHLRRQKPARIIPRWEHSPASDLLAQHLVLVYSTSTVRDSNNPLVSFN